MNLAPELVSAFEFLGGCLALREDETIRYRFPRVSRELSGDKHEAELHLLKSRDGRTARSKATLNVKSLRFEEVKENPAKVLARYEHTKSRKEQE